MKIGRYVPVLVAITVVALLIAPCPKIVEVVAGVSLVLLIPGYALGRAILSSEGPVGESTTLSICVSLAVAGIIALSLALFHVFGRMELIASLTLVSAGAGVAAHIRGRLMLDSSATRPFPVRAVALGAVVVALASLILTLAFERDSASSAAQLSNSSVALAAVRENASLQIQVLPSNAFRFSGMVLLKSMSVTVDTWAVREVGPGGQWTVVVPNAPFGSLQVILMRGGAQLRILHVSPIAEPGGSTR